MAFTEFYCQTGASNVNAGSTTNNTAAYTATNGGWNSGTGLFTPTSGDPSLSVAVGDWASVYLDAATTAVFIGRVTAVSSTTITVSTSIKGGTPPTTGGTGITCKVGGAWLGPNAADNSPAFTIFAKEMVNSSSNPPRCNLKGGTSYSITTGISHSNGGVVFQGYTSTVADGGRATIDAGGNSINIVITSGANCIWRDLIFRNTSSGAFLGLSLGGAKSTAIRCVVNTTGRAGFVLGSNQCKCIECEAYACNSTNTATRAAFQMAGADSECIRCIAHDNTAGANCDGFFVDSGASAFISDCISDTNAGKGIDVGASAASCIIKNSDLYNNTGSGIYFNPGAVSSLAVENCNLVKNGGYGIEQNGTNACNIYVSNCGFGAGTQANSSGTTTFATQSSVTVENSVSYASNVTPWVDPANGDFRINLAAAINAGRGAFTETASSYAGAIGYPDIGAVQHLEGGGGMFGNSLSAGML